MQRKLFLFILLLFFLKFTGFSQGYLLVLSDADCVIMIDEGEKSLLIKDTPKKINLGLGSHFVQCWFGEKKILKEVSIEEGKQSTLQLNFSTPVKGQLQKGAQIVKQENRENNLEDILIADLNFTALGSVNGVIEQSLDFSKSDLLSYAFDKGDEILINADILNKKGKLHLSVYSYPDKNLIYSKQKIETLENHRIKIKQRGIYLIEIGTHAVFDKKMHLVIKRKPAGRDNIDFNTKVVKRAKYTPKELNNSLHFVNSTSHELFKGGTNEIIIPISIPTDAVDWFYSFSASRNKEEVNASMGQINLVGDLAKAIKGSNPTTAAISIGIEMLNKPPGANYCDVFLMDYTNMAAFKSDVQMSYIIKGSRKNLKSSTVQVGCCMDGQEYYLGIQNNSKMHGIHVGMQAVAIIKEEYLDFE